MTVYPELMLAMAHDRQRVLVDEADRARLLRSARQWARSSVSVTGRHNAGHAPVRRTAS